MNHEPYIEALRDRKKVLSITASGDQILNSILFGGKEITGTDISAFPKYFAALKIAALKTLSKEEFLIFTLGSIENNIPVLSLKLYEKVRKNLDPVSLSFWDEVLSFFEKEKIDTDKIFNQFCPSYERVKKQNPYLDDKNYKRLRKMLEDAYIEFYDLGIEEVNKNTFGKFDLILLSNVINYIDFSSLGGKTLKDNYIKFFKNLPLENNGLAVAYNFAFCDTLSDVLSNNKIKIHKVKEQILSTKVENEIIVFENKPKILSLIRKK